MSKKMYPDEKKFKKGLLKECVSNPDRYQALHSKVTRHPDIYLFSKHISYVYDSSGTSAYIAHKNTNCLSKKPQTPNTGFQLDFWTERAKTVVIFT